MSQGKGVIDVRLLVRRLAVRLSVRGILLVSLLAVTLLAPTVGAGQGNAPTTVEIRLWVNASNVDVYRALNIETAAERLNRELASKGSNLRVKVTSVIDDASWGDYKRKFVLAADAGRAPDIVLSGHEDVAVWSQAGYIIPLTEQVRRDWQTVYHDVFPTLWDAARWNGQIWGVPQDTEARPMFFNKVKLSQLGWSNQQIESLPDRIARGDFTLDDLIATAKEAIRKGVVKPGYGYWHRPVKGGDFLQYYVSYGGVTYDPTQNKLVISRDALVKWYAFQRRVVTEGITPPNFIGTEWRIWHETVSRGDVLFWNGGIWQFADWAENYVKDLGGADYLYKFVGWALQPSGIRGRPGNTLSHPLVYMVTSERASGRKNQGIAFRLITLATDPELNNRHAVKSSHLAILQSQVNMGDYAKLPVLRDAAKMLNYAWYQPNHPDYGQYFDILFAFMQAVEAGEFTPEEGARLAIDELLRKLPQSVIVR